MGPTISDGPAAQQDESGAGDALIVYVGCADSLSSGALQDGQCSFDDTTDIECDPPPKKRQHLGSDGLQGYLPSFTRSAADTGLMTKPYATTLDLASSVGHGHSSASTGPLVASTSHDAPVAAPAQCAHCERCGYNYIVHSQQCQQLQRLQGCHACDRLACWVGSPSCLFRNRDRYDCPDGGASGVPAPNMFDRTPVTIMRTPREVQVTIGNQIFFKGTASGSGNNCLIDSLRQSVQDIMPGAGCIINASWIRLQLIRRFGANSVAPVTPLSYLDLRAHFRDVIELLGESARHQGCDPRRHIVPDNFMVTCVYEERRVIGDVIGAGPARLTILNEGQRHFVPLIRILCRRAS